MQKLTRREFLRLFSMLPFGFLLPSSGQSRLNALHDIDKPNIIIIIFDAMSARNLSLYGYPRDTTPNLKRFADRATVYHSHYSPSNFTTPSIASILTGTFPWTHRAIHLAGLIHQPELMSNLFSEIGESHHRIAFSQNYLSDLLLSQFRDEIDRHLQSGDFALINNTLYDKFFQEDPIIASKSLDEFALSGPDSPGTFFLSVIESRLTNALYYKELEKHHPEFPRGLPNHQQFRMVFLLEDVIDGIISILKGLTTSSAIFIHLLPPHESYRPPRDTIYPARKEFIGIFDDQMVPAPKASHFFSEGYSPEELVRKRLAYDEFIAYVDAEFGRLLDFLISTGFLDSSYIMVTSDHGQLFNRGVHGHITPLLYEPLIHIPLIISKPGQTSREDIYLKTSSVDILPTISSIFGRNKSRFEGKLLPGFGGDLKKDNTIYAMEAKMSPRNEVTKIGTYVIIEDRYKLIYYRGYSGFSDVIELYDLVNDPDETEDLHKIKKNIANDLLYMLNIKIIH